MDAPRLLIGDGRRLDHLDGYRGLASLIVIGHHYFMMSYFENLEGKAPWIMRLLFQSYGIIDYFFVLSGWLIGTILLSNKNSPHFFKTFYIRRAARVLPLYFLVVFVYLFFSKTYEKNFPWLFNDPLIPLWAYPFALQTLFGGMIGTLGDRFIYVTWSVIVEFHFYIMAPWIVRFVSKQGMIVFYIFLVALAFYLRFLIPGEARVWERTLIFWRPEAIFGGLLISYFTFDGTIFKMKKYFFWLIYFILLPGIILMAFDFYFGKFLYTWMSFTAMAFFAALLVWPGWLEKFFSWKPLCWLGEISYSTYLWHVPALGVFFQWVYNSEPFAYRSEGFVPACICLAATLVMAGLSYRFIEMPFLKWGKKYSY
ncbi:MAG: acyltransferase [Flavobacteriales bacterium]|nr:acyltransferase [Flavobacteriales bacterium]